MKMDSLLKKIKILIVDDHVLSRRGLRDMLQDQTAFTPIIREAKDGEEAIKCVSSEHFDLVLLDLQMPNVDGYTALSELREKENDTPIIIFSFYIDTLLIQRMLRAGANGFMSKGVSMDELMKGVCRVLDGETYYSGIDKQHHGSEPVLNKSLTSREWQILKLIAEEASNIDIAEALCISVRTVEGHKKNLTDKLNVKGSVGLTKYAIKNGIVKNR